MKEVKGILLMAGSGERFGADLPKQFHEIAGKKVYLWTLERFVESQLFEEIFLVCPPERVDEVQEEVGPAIRVVAGGTTRQESSYLGLLACGEETEIVVIHDGVRPFVSQEILEANIKGAKLHGAVDTCIPSSDTLVYAPNEKEISAIPHRSEYFRGQTPQSFSYPLILKAHKETRKENATDDCSLVLELDESVYIVAGEEENLKITSPIDLLIAEEIIKLDGLWAGSRPNKDASLRA